MKTLLLIRHAKSSWKNSDLSDYQRPLNKRGLRDAPYMGKRIAHWGCQPEQIISSPSLRALTTAKPIATELNYNPINIIENEKIYGAGDQELVQIIQSFDDQFENIMLVTHNPGITNLANGLTNENILNIPTCGALQISFEIDNWRDIKDHTGILIEFNYPKRLSSTGS